MSKLTVEFCTNNAAFEEPGEIARLLREAAGAFADVTNDQSGMFRLIDINGNRVGYAAHQEGETQ